ncbi:MAG TPA: hypothetical protein VNM48_09885 [Chloroflexota bacterium]|nr:hypothetical protein [Chloroflexota bacterium]
MTEPADLWRWTDRLTLPVKHRLVREDGHTEHLTLPSLLDQLEDDLGSTSGANGRSKPGSRPPLNMTALSLLGELEVVILDAIAGEDLEKRQQTLGRHLRQVVAHLVSTADPDVVDWWTRLVKGWVAEVQACLPGEDEGAGQIPIRGMCCPTCRTWTVERVTDGVKYRDAALILVMSNRMVRHAICRACGENWFRGEPLWVLARSADGESRSA